MANENNRDKFIVFVVLVLGLFSYTVLLTYHNIADGDLWARFVQGASVWIRGTLVHEDMFAFTPVLPEYVDHEYGVGVVLFTLLKLFGPESLLLFKIILGIAAIGVVIAAGRLNNASWPALLMLTLPAAITVLPGYAVVVRSHAFTYLFFSITLFCLEIMRRKRLWASFVIIVVMIAWSNVHGGFVSGLGIIGIYSAYAFFTRHPFSKVFLLTMLASIGATFINPFGPKLWTYIFTALTHPRHYLPEWYPVPLLSIAVDSYVGFRILLLISVVIFLFGCRHIDWKGRIPGLAVVFVSLYFAVSHRRHVPFFGLSAVAFLGPYLSATAKEWGRVVPGTVFKRVNPLSATLVLYFIAALFVARYILPKAPFQVWAPVGIYPVRECDILMYAKAKGNAVVPYGWGNYVMWRLYPDIKISQCGRYETIYPEQTIALNYNFYYKNSNDWGRLIRKYPVDYIIVDYNGTYLTHEDMQNLRYELIWADGYSALYARRNLASSLKKVALGIDRLPSVQTLDPRIPEKWWPQDKNIKGR